MLTAGAPEGESQAERMRREFEEERLRLREERKKGGHTAQRAANVGLLQPSCYLMHFFHLKSAVSQ